MSLPTPKYLVLTWKSSFYLRERGLPMETRYAYGGPGLLMRDRRRTWGTHIHPSGPAFQWGNAVDFLQYHSTGTLVIFSSLVSHILLVPSSCSLQNLFFSGAFDLLNPGSTTSRCILQQKYSFVDSVLSLVRIWSWSRSRFSLQMIWLFAQSLPAVSGGLHFLSEKGTVS